MKHPLKKLHVRTQPKALAYSKDMVFSPDPVLSYFLSALSLFVPIAEHDFIHHVREAMPLIKNDALRDQAQAFIRQEGHHAHAHHQLNACLAEKRGMPEVLEGMKAFWRSSKAKALAYRPGLQGALMFTVFGESLSAAIGDYLFRTWSERLDAWDPHAAYIMFYHAVEEIEHKGLSYNLYVDLYGEDPNATEEDVALCRAWQTHYVDMICTTIRRLFLLDIQNPDVPLDALPPVRRILCGKEGLFEGGLIDQRLLTLHEHPWDYDNAHWITLWDDVLEPKLRARL